jgi:bacterial/archaeal transporter family protein
MFWQSFVLGSAFFAGLTAIFGKLGVAELNSNLATFIRTVVILAMTIGIVTLRDEWRLPIKHCINPVTYKNHSNFIENSNA